MIKIIAAIADFNIIGINGELPWIIPEDLQHFKSLTTSNKIVMGWKTWESLGCKPLPNRLNIILSRRKKKVPKGVELYTNPSKIPYKNFWVIGGEDIFRYFLPLADELYITEVMTTVICKPKDIISHFPSINKTLWNKKTDGVIYSDNNYNFMKVNYKRK